MSTKIINDIKEVINVVNYNYRVKKYPVFIKNFIANRERAKIKKVIDKLPNDFVSSELLYEYINDNISYMYENGKFEHCVSSTYKKYDQLCSACFKYEIASSSTIPNEKITVVAMFDNLTEDTSIARFTLFNSKGNIKYNFLMNIGKKLAEGNMNIAFNFDTEKQLAYNTLLNIICKDIKKYLYNCVEITERINL